MPLSTTPSLSRRSLLLNAGRTAAGIAVLGGAGSFLSACASSSAGDGSDGTVAYQLSWTKDYEFAGSYLADDRGYWADNDLKVDLLAGGSSADPLSIVASGKAMLASAHVHKVAQLMDSGGTKLKVVGALMQKYGLNILSRSDAPITSPKELEGKKIGVFPSNDPAWALFLELNDIDRSTITEVPVQYDLTPLINGEIDGYQAYAGGELTTLRSAGVEPVALLLADYGYNPVSAGYVVRAESLEDKDQRAQIKSFLIGEIKGWQDVVYGDGLEEGARLTVEKYGKDLGLDPETQLASLEALMPFISTPTTEEKGLLWMSDDSIASSQVVLDNAGIGLDVTDIVDLSLLEEIYGGKNRL